MASSLERLIRFGVVGAGNTLLYTLLVAGFVNFVTPWPAMASAVAYVICTACSFALNTLWSFSAPLSSRALLRFCAVSALGFVMTVAIAQTVEALGGHYFVGIACVVLVVTPCTFLAHRSWTYR